MYKEQELITRHSGNPPAGGDSRDPGRARTFWIGRFWTLYHLIQG